jgi:hypothetical protein
MPPPPALPALTLALAMTVAIAAAAVGTRSSSPSSPQPIVAAVHDAIKARGKGGGPDAAPSSLWTPNIVHTRSGTTIILAMAKPTFTNYVTSSRDGGKTWVHHAQPKGPPGTSQLLYSPTSNTVFLLGKSPNMVDNGTRPGNSSFLYMSKSTDDAVTWTEPTPINQTNPTYGAHYGGSGRTQGIELQRGPHKGRLVVPKIGRDLAQPDRPARGEKHGHLLNWQILTKTHY